MTKASRLSPLSQRMRAYRGKKRKGRCTPPALFYGGAKSRHERRRGGSKFHPKKRTVVPAASSLVTEVIGDPGRSGALARVDECLGGKFHPKKRTVVPAGSSLVTGVIGDPARSGGPRPCRWRTCCARAGHTWGRPHVGRDFHRDVAVDKLIRACSVDPPEKHTVAIASGGYEWPSRSTA